MSPQRATRYPSQNVFRPDVVGETLTPRAGAAERPGCCGRTFPRDRDPGGGAVSDLTRLTAAALSRSSRAERSRASRRRTRTWIGSPPSTATSTRSCTSATTPWMSRPTSTAAAPRAMSSARSPVCLSPSRTCSSRPTCPRPAARASSRATCRPSTRPSSRARAPRDSCRSARPTWTSSRWARRPSTPPTARRTTRGTSTAFPAAPAAVRPRPSPPSRRRSRSARDTGGSIRQPAHLTGTVGVKPTYGGVSRYGAIALASSLDQVGPVTRSVLDAGLLHDVIGGHDHRDSTSLTDAWPSFAEAAREGARGDVLKGLRVGVVRELPDSGFQPGCRASLPRVARAARGATAPRSSRSAPRTSSTASPRTT